MPQPLVTENAKHIVDKETDKIGGIFHEQLLYVETKISPSDLEELKNKAKDCLENQNNFENSNNTLAGNIEKEFFLDKSFKKILLPYYSSLAKKFIDIDINYYNKKNFNWDLSGFWINFQKKHEFNPLHDHTGDFSFVLWIQIPYNLEEELKLDNCINANSQKNSLFSFTYIDPYGNLVEKPLPIDKTWEGTIVLFRSNLKHQVFPFFTSDDYRISISGNLIRIPESKKTFSYQ